jgi:hypothetical protein
VLDRWHITGDLTIAASNVSIVNSQIDGIVSNADAAGSAFSIADSTVGPATGCLSGIAIGEHHFTATRVKVRGVNNLFRVMAPGSVTIRDSFALGCSLPDGHAEGVQACCFAAGYDGVTVDHNTIDLSAAPEAGPAVDLNDGGLTHVTVTSNLLVGGSYTQYLSNSTPVGAATPAWTVSGNKVADGSWVFGPFENDGTCPSLAWGSGNDLVTLSPDYSIASTVQRDLPCT